jgi:hypothetical protein
MSCETTRMKWEWNIYMTKRVSLYSSSEMKSNVEHSKLKNAISKWVVINDLPFGLFGQQVNESENSEEVEKNHHLDFTAINFITSFGLNKQELKVYIIWEWECTSSINTIRGCVISYCNTKSRSSLAGSFALIIIISITRRCFQYMHFVF